MTYLLIIFIDWLFQKSVALDIAMEKTINDNLFYFQL